MKADMEYAAGEVRKLDQWAQGALAGAVFATVFWAGIAWTAMEPLK